MNKKNQSRYSDSITIPKPILALIAALPFITVLVIGVGLLNNWRIVIEIGKGLGFVTAILVGTLMGLFAT